MATMGNRMRDDSDTDEKERLIREAGGMHADDPHDALRADVLGSIAGANPNSGEYLGKIDSLITAHGALEAPSMQPPPLEPGSRGYEIAVGGTSQPRMRPPTATMAEPPNLDKTPNAMMGRPTLGPDTPPGSDSDLIPTRMGQQPKPGILGRIGHVVTRMGDIAGTALAPGIMANIPGTMLNKRMEANRAERRSEKERQLSIEETRAGAEKETADTRAKLEPSEEDKNLAEAFKARLAPEAKTDFEAWQRQNPNAPVSEWLKLLAQNKTGTDEEQFVAKYLKDKNLPDTAENRLAGATEYKNGAPIGDNDAKQLTTQIANALKGTGIDPSGYIVSAKSTRGEANEALKAAQAAANEHRTMTAPEAAQNRKDARTMGYAIDEKGELKYMSKADADKIHSTFEELKPADVNKDRQAIRQLNDVQMNTSRYRKAIDALPEALSPLAVTNMTSVLSDKGFGAKLEPFGVGLDIGMVNDAIKGTAVASAWNSLKPEERNVLIGYLRAKSSVIAYQKALTGVGRTNKEQLEIEMNNLPLPFVGATVADPQMNAWQENVDRATEGFPTNLPGIKSPKQVRQESEGGTHNFSVNGVQYRNVTEEDYARAKKLKGFKE